MSVVELVNVVSPLMSNLQMLVIVSVSAEASALVASALAASAELALELAAELALELAVSVAESLNVEMVVSVTVTEVYVGVLAMACLRSSMAAVSAGSAAFEEASEADEEDVLVEAEADAAAADDAPEVVAWPAHPANVAAKAVAAISAKMFLDTVFKPAPFNEDRAQYTMGR